MAESANLTGDFLREESLMYFGPLVFTQVMDFIPMKTFQQCVARYRGNFSMESLPIGHFQAHHPLDR
jgi:hypothetical protein